MGPWIECEVWSGRKDEERWVFGYEKTKRSLDCDLFVKKIKWFFGNLVNFFFKCLSYIVHTNGKSTTW